MLPRDDFFKHIVFSIDKIANTREGVMTNATLKHRATDDDKKELKRNMKPVYTVVYQKKEGELKKQKEQADTTAMSSEDEFRNAYIIYREG